ncbi:hypothetical protein [Curtobacterium sp. HSID17257]|uniref:hypothetical protein n=1 Tax=Curtobacterium sp. HSID17257 TaxID=2419510 RepID=UPI000F86769F|nr:hypothetical protein [Curtobacterium sp. HSID17257]
MKVAYRISLAALIASGVGFLAGIAIFVIAFDEADAHPKNQGAAGAIVVLAVSTAFGVLALISTIVTALNRRDN